MGVVLENAILCDLDPIRVERGALRIDNGKIVARGAKVASDSGDVTIDCDGAVVLPGLVNGHTHIYSALAAGMPMPSRMPTNFHEILKFIWWRLDRALDEPSIEASGLIGALDALRCGTTTLIDHHASPSLIDGSLEILERGMATAGVRGVLCYEVTDRNGLEGGRAGLRENERYLQARTAAVATSGARGAGRFAGLVGAHAAFTMADDTLAATADLARRTGTGVHIHVAEDPCDDAICRSTYGTPLLDRLAAHGLLAAPHVLGHGTHLPAEAVARLGGAGATMAHNTRSNMNNAVGYLQVKNVVGPLLLGTDGIGGDMFSEAKTCWFRASEGKQGWGPANVLELLAQNARTASRLLGVTLGKLEVGAEADIVLTDYRPATPIDSANFPAHFIFALGSQHVRSVMCDGAWLMRDRVVPHLDETAVRAQVTEAARAMWQRMEAIPLD